MKKFIIFFGLMSAVFVLQTPALAECNCSGEEIIDKIRNVFPTWRKESLVRDLLNSNSAQKIVIDQIKDSQEFKRALKNYIEYNCSVEDGKIKCN